MPASVIGRVGGWCMRRWGWVLLAWAVAVTAGALASGPVFERLTDSGVPREVESVAAYDVLRAGNDSAGTVVAVIDGLSSPREAAAAVAGVAPTIAAVPGVAAVEHPFDEGLPPRLAARMVSRDERAVLVSAKLENLTRPERDSATAAIAERLHALTASDPPVLPPGATVEVGGGPVRSKQVNDAVQADLQRGEVYSLPLTLIVLIIVFGGIVAAGLPVLTAGVSVAAAMGVLLGFSAVTDITRDAVTVVTLLGLALAIDYGLLLVARYREELRRGHAPDAAVARAWARAGRTIAFSALTVAVSLSGLLMFDLPTLTGLGAAGVSIALMAMLASLTLTAALIGLLKRWIRPGRRRRASPGATDPGGESERGWFARLALVVQRRPLLVALVTGIMLLGAGAPALSAPLRLPGLEGLPRSLEAVRVADTLAQRFDQPQEPAVTVVARTTPEALRQWAVRLGSDPAVSAVRPVQVVDGATSSVAVDVRGDPQAAPVRELVERIRADRPPGGPSWVTGDAAVLSDLLGLLSDGLPYALGVTVAAMVVLLFAMTGSIVVPVKAVLANLISLGATFGVLTAVFGHGFASGLLDTITTGSLNPFILVIIFAFAFGLSMDYELFLLARVKEYVDAGVPTDSAVRRGLAQTGRVITSAALLMVIVFSAFAAATVGNIEQIGLGLAVAVLIDATIVRCLLVPATMTLLGRWNWWAPGFLRRLHDRIGLRERPLPRGDQQPQAPVAIGAGRIGALLAEGEGSSESR